MYIFLSISIKIGNLHFCNYLGNMSRNPIQILVLWNDKFGSLLNLNFTQTSNASDQWNPLLTDTTALTMFKVSSTSWFVFPSFYTDLKQTQNSSVFMPEITKKRAMNPFYVCISSKLSCKIIISGLHSLLFWAFFT